MLSDEWLLRYELLENLEIKLCRSMTGTRPGEADADDRGDCNSSPCTSYRRANKDLTETKWAPTTISNLGCSSLMLLLLY